MRNAADERRPARDVSERRRRFKRHRRADEAHGTGPVKTFSVGYGEAEYSELAYARTVSRSIGTEHHEVVVGMDDFFNALPQSHLARRRADHLAVQRFSELRIASGCQEVKVVLTGEGSDELFAGYGRYRFYLLNRKWMDRYRMVPGPVRGWIRSSVETSRLLSAAQRRKLRHTFLGLGENIESLYIDNFYSALRRRGAIADSVT